MSHPLTAFALGVACGCLLSYACIRVQVSRTKRRLRPLIERVVKERIGIGDGPLVSGLEMLRALQGDPPLPNKEHSEKRKV